MIVLAIIAVVLTLCSEVVVLYYCETADCTLRLLPHPFAGGSGVRDEGSWERGGGVFNGDGGVDSVASGEGEWWND
jgi:hypothetical protein